MDVVKRPLLWGIILLFLSFNGFAQIDVNQVMPVDPKVKIGRLTNGLTYYIRHNPLPEKRAELRLVVNAGSVLEDEDQLGLAHFMEHMNFNGTKRFPKNELVSYLQSIGVKFGADLNAYTGFDETVYILPVPTDKPGLVEKGLEILEDWAHNALLDPDEIEKERGVVIEEWRLSRGADERMMRQTLPVQYRGSRYAERLPIGNRTILENFSPEALKRFYRDWYRPDLQAVIVVGDIDVNEIEQKIISIFSDIPAPASPRVRPLFDVPDHAESLTVVAKDKETAFPSVQILFKKDPQPDTSIEDYFRYMNRRMFTEMFNTRLRELTLSPNPPFIQATSFYGNTLARTKDGYFLYANSSDTGMARSLSALMTEARRVMLHGFTAAEFERQKKQMQSYYDRIFSEREKEESFKYVNEYINNFLVNEPIPGIEWEYDFVRHYLANIQLEQINQLASQWVTAGNMVVTLNAPEKEGVKIPSEEDVKAVVKNVETASIAPYVEKEVASALLDESRIKAGKIIKTTVDEDLQTTTLTLSNGATVILKPTNFKNDEILFRAFSMGGHSLVKDADYFSALNASAIVAQSGVGKHSAIDLINMMKGKSTSVTPAIGSINESMFGNTIPKETETLLQLVHLYFTSPRKDESAFESFRTRQKQLYQNLGANPQIYFSNEFQKLMTQNHPRGGGLPKPEDYDKINLDRSIAIYKERFANAGDFTFLFVGAFDDKEILPLIEKYIGGLPGKAADEKFRDLGIRPPTGMVEKTISKGAEQQSLVTMQFISPVAYNNADAYALRSLGELLSIKLVEKLREEKGSVYGVSASGTINKYPYSYSSFSITFPCAPENADTLSKAALEELKQIIRGGVHEEDLAKVKEQQRRKLETDLQQNQYWMNGLFNALYLDVDAKKILLPEQQIESLTAKKLQEVAKKYINPSSFIRAILLPEKPGDQRKPF
jgi:zinc protease